jgi:uncharacterized membrane protein
MVSVEYFEGQEPGSYVGQIVMQPNNSMSWQATQYFLCTLIAISMTMATLFLFKGYWMILPFSILEMSVLCACFYYIVRRNQTLEVVRFGADEVVIEKGRRAPESRYVWQRFFTKVMVHPPKHPWYPNRIALRYRGEEYEIGKFLTAEDKQTLISEIRQMIAVADSRQVQR